VHGENAVLSMKIMSPHFRMAKNQILAVDNTRKGRILLEFSPRGPNGKYMWEDLIRFGLSAEETGLLVNQLPHYKVEFSRLQSARGDNEQAYGTVVTTDTPEKVLTVEPGELGAVNFTIDYVRDGVGGQSPGLGQDGKVSLCRVMLFDVACMIMFADFSLSLDSYRLARLEFRCKRASLR
jgi:hypothetical protein